MKDYQVMPPLTDEEYAELKADIAERGVMVPIELDQDGNVLDGHHRLKICEELGRTDYPTIVRIFHTEEARLEHAFRLNINRRHLTPSQKTEVARKLKTEHPELSIQQIADIMESDWRTVYGQVQDLQNVPTVEGADGKHYPASADEAQAQREAIRETINENPELSDRKIADMMGVSHHTVAKQRDAINNIVSVFNPSKRDADALRDPDIQRRLAENDGMNVAGAIREQRRDQLVEHLESVETREAKAVQGVYDVIVVDPPWPMERIETDRNPHAVAMDYPTMTIEEIEQLKIPAADDCHVFLWTTQKWLMNGDALEILRAWGVKPVWCFVWHKNHGHKPFGLPKNNCEFCLYGHIGNPTFVREDKFWSCIEQPITAHSEKPEKFYDMIRHVTAGRRLDMFNRRSIEGFDGWGKEAS